MKAKNPDNLKTLIRPVLFMGACLLLGLPSGYSRDEIDRDQRLNILNRTTGKEYTSNTFEARMDAIFNTTATQERSLIGAQDAAIRAKTAAAKQESLKKESLAREATRPGKDITKVKDTALKSKSDMTEKNYLAEKEKLQKANAERLRRLQTPEGSQEKKKSASSNSNVSLSLKNNPFYHGNFSKSPRNDFEDQKAVYASRLINQFSMDKSDAERLVTQSSSPEDLMINLMEEQDMTYQDASDVVSYS